MTDEQQATNEVIEGITYLLQQKTISLNNCKHTLKKLHNVNKVKHHQIMMNVDYANEILTRSVTLLNELKHN